MSIKVHDSWQAALKDEFASERFQNLTQFVREAYQNKSIYPAPKNIFRALDLCPFDKVKVVILGQDPYHGPGQAHGLCFSVREGVALPPSLRNIYKEMATDLEVTPPQTGDLSHWAEQGVLLLNATLTVEARKAGSHQGKGWEEFTDSIIQKISEEKEHVVFILWGSYAQRKGRVIDRDKHLVLEAPHPSPLSAHRGFFGSKPFSQTNDYLAWHDASPIEWVNHSA